MSSRDQHSSSNSRKRDRSPEDRYQDSSSSRKSHKDKDRDRDRSRDRDRDRNRDHEKDRDRHSSHSSRRDSSPKRSHSSLDKNDRDERRGGESRHSSNKEGKRSRDDDRKRSKRGKDKERSKGKESRRSRHRESSISESSESESQSGTDSETGSDSDDEMVKKAKSMIKKISMDDYFSKSAEFRLWLRQSKKKYFEDLSAEDARKYFKKFVRAWNDFDLDESYYKGIRSSQLQSSDLTKYKWGFAKKIGKDDLNKVEAVRDSIDTMTNTRFAQEVNRLVGKTTADSGTVPRRTLGPEMPPSANVGNPRRPMTADEVADKEDRDRINRLHNRAEQRAYRKSKEADLEELVPKATGREAMLEKRRAQTAYNRRERSPDVELSEQDLMGTGGDFKSMLAAEKKRKEAREEYKSGRNSASTSLRDAKQQAYKEKEDKQIEALRQLWAQSQASKGL